MRLSFCKYQGSGNDFILVDDRSCFFPVQDQKTIRFLCSRNWGIGADGLILLQPSSSADFRMRIFNSDGLEADFCGNGLRCLIVYLKDLGYLEQSFLIETALSVVCCGIQGSLVSVAMPTPKVLHWGIKLGEDFPSEVFVVNTGVPHAVTFVDDLAQYPVDAIGRMIRFHPLLGSEGANVNFVKIGVDGVLRIRTYERGVEGETLSCGSGAAAAALVAFQKEKISPSVRVVAKSGESLEFFISESFEGKKINMQGNAFYVFEGRIEV